ncbi:MAG: hypothetical protein Q9M31_01655 [Mariprofundus sp.]|nr:hypothetical protein [Mariprofundus sp.]
MVTVIKSLVGVTLFLISSIQIAEAGTLLDWLHHSANQAGQDELRSADNARLLTLEPGENEMYPKVSPDDKHLLVVSGKPGKQVFSVRQLENGDQRYVVGDYQQLVFDSATWHGSGEISFLSYRGDGLSLWKKQADDSVVRTLHSRQDGLLRSPKLLADGSIIAVRLVAKRTGSFSRKNKLSLKAEFNNWNRAGYDTKISHISKYGADTMLAPGLNPSLSPDGKRVVYAMRDGQSYHLFIMNVDGSDLVQLTDGASVDVQPAWSSDGKWLAFTSNRASISEQHHHKDNWDIWMIGRDGTNLMRLTKDAAKDGAPTVADNGQVYFHSDRKVTADDKAAHQVHKKTTGFHVWMIVLPAKVS